MARRKKKQVKDETIVDIVEAKETAQDYFERNKVLVLAIVGALVVIIGGYLFYDLLVKTPNEESAKEAMYRAEEQFARDSFALALENPGAGFDGFLDIIDNYPGTSASNLAKYYSGISYLNLGRYEAAIEFLEDFSPGGEVTPIMKFGALGDAYSETGDLDKALSMYKKATDTDNSFLTPYYLKKYGLLAEKQGDSGSAQNAYNRIKDEYPESAEAQDIEKYIAGVQ
ncbi:MAG: tetratricopeptide repeat protein [Saprospiraceae bacterium]|nr:tetratricopeptide repeat protein [Saprospiraceae bacterium]